MQFSSSNENNSQVNRQAQNIIEQYSVKRAQTIAVNQNQNSNDQQGKFQVQRTFEEKKNYNNPNMFSGYQVQKEIIITSPSLTEEQKQSQTNFFQTSTINSSNFENPQRPSYQVRVNAPQSLEYKEEIVTPLTYRSQSQQIGFPSRQQSSLGIGYQTTVRTNDTNNGTYSINSNNIEYIDKGPEIVSKQIEQKTYKTEVIQRNTMGIQYQFIIEIIIVDLRMLLRKLMKRNSVFAIYFDTMIRFQQYINKQCCFQTQPYGNLNGLDDMMKQTLLYICLLKILKNQDPPYFQKDVVFHQEKVNILLRLVWFYKCGGVMKYQQLGNNSSESYAISIRRKALEKQKLERKAAPFLQAMADIRYCSIDEKKDMILQEIFTPEYYELTKDRYFQNDIWVPFRPRYPHMYNRTTKDPRHYKESMATRYLHGLDLYNI